MIILLNTIDNMKEKLIKSIFFLSFLFIAYSCSDDDTMEDEMNNNGQTEFTIHAGEIQAFSGDRYIMATSPYTGEVLYWDVMTSFDDNITFDANGLETVDLTYAFEFGSYFNVTTYRDVKSEFKLSGYIYPCFEDQISYDILDGKSVDIIFPGTKEIVEFLNPAYDHSDLQVMGNVSIDEENKIVYDLENNYTIVNAKLASATLDLQFTFRFQGEQDYKSIIVKSEDWVEVDEDNYKLDLEIEDLMPCSVYEIEVGIDDTWIVDSEVLTSSGDRVTIAKWSHYAQNQMGDKIKLFLQDDVDIDQMFLKISRNNRNNGFQFQNYFDDIPTSISLMEYNNEVSDLTPNTFKYSTPEDFDLVKTSYEYVFDNYISSWDIYQSSSSTSEYKLPIIESSFLEETTLLKAALINPREFRIQFYSLDVPVNQVYHETGINRQLQCLSYNSSYETYDF